eukprot:190379_1
MVQGSKISDISKCSSMIIVKNKAAFNSGILRSDIGIGETYFREEWTYDSNKYDLGDIITHVFWNVLNNATPFTKYLTYLSIFEWKEYFYRLNLVKDRSIDMIDVNSHYNTNKFFAKVFENDPTWTYTSAYFNKSATSLFDAQINHWNILLHKLDLQKYDKLDVTQTINFLNIGFGWGYFEKYIANKWSENTSIKYNVTAITISNDQYEYVSNLNTNFNTQSPYYYLMDFRDLPFHYPPNFFHNILSIGVISHIHLLALDEMFEIVYGLLKPGGYFLLDGIAGTSTFAEGDTAYLDRRYGCTSSNFIYKYIFPGLCIIVGDWIHESAVKAGFLVMHREYGGQSYAKTLREWRFNLNKHKDYLLSNSIVTKKRYLSYDIYFAQSEAAFRIGKVEQAQFLFYKPKKDEIHKRKFQEYETDIFLSWQGFGS